MLKTSLLGLSRDVIVAVEIFADDVSRFVGSASSSMKRHIFSQAVKFMEHVKHRKISSAIRQRY